MRSIGVLTRWATLAAFAAQGAAGDPPPASFQLDFEGDAAVWSPFEGFESCDTDSENTTACFHIEDVACDGKGGCTGDATFTLSGTIVGTLHGPATASAKCKQPAAFGKPVCNARLGFQVGGTMVGYGKSCDGQVQGTMSGPIDAGGVFSARTNMRLCVQCPGAKPGCGSGPGTLVEPVHLPTPWSVSVEVLLDARGSKLAGTAHDSLGFSYTAKGSYNAKRDESSISLTGDKGTVSSGARISLQNLTASDSSVVDGIARISVQGTQSTVDLAP